MAQNGGNGNNGVKFEAPQPHSVKEQLPGIQYCINSSPTWPEAIVLGFQHYLLTLGITVLIPSILVPQMGGGNVEKATVIQSLLFVSGLSTLFQSFLGTRLPIVVVGSYAYLIPVTSIIQASRYSSCTDPYERFVRTMKGIQGALIAAACFQSALGFLGLWRNAVRFLSPLSVVPYVTFTGLGLYHLGFPMLAKCVEVGLPGIILMVFISQYLPRYIQSKRLICDRFSILFTVAITWLFAQLLTSTNVYKHKPENTQISCRTDRAGLITTAPWIYFPYPFQWGSPTFNARDVFVMMAPALVSLFESTGTFFAAARYGSATPVPPSVISRGAGWLSDLAVAPHALISNVLFSSSTYRFCSALSPKYLYCEKGLPRPCHGRHIFGGQLRESCVRQNPPETRAGIGVLLNGFLGSVTGTTASVENVGLLALTRVGSRRVIQISAGFMIFFSIFAKFGAIFASIPLPIVAALYCVLFSYVSSAGLSFLQFCNLNSFKTKFILGFSFFMGLSVPQYFREYFHGGWRSPHHIGLFSDIILVIFMSHTTVAALIALFFDLTLSRENDETRKDIGLNWWERFSLYKSDVRNEEFYALPCSLNKLFPSI
ncbi:Nucleobase-ascorbate transporter 8 [Hibiscus syriacus]|uniref:Nucleobase-ascorbate transporter 8 n=1 Tax=Hibiscus syriacus TaxID=106335 RepID=A0A6A2X440_HIBSY|nr:Nucleobase-ascorbate transporter 8 [Hibiscus syriacus]